MSKSPHYVKLSSFELATSVSSGIQHEIESKYRRNSKRADDSLSNIPIYALLMRNNDKMLKSHYRDMSKHIARDMNVTTNCYSIHCLSDVAVEYLPYLQDYRRQLSVYNYQAPELLTSSERFVYPTRRSDVYSLTLLLWELLNYSVPFVIFNESELKRLYRENRVELPMFEKRRCNYFKQIFKYGTATDPVNRSVTVQHFISLLEDIKFDIDSENVVNRTEPCTRTERMHTTADSVEDMEIGESSNRLHQLTYATNESDQKENIYENTEDIMNDIDAQLISPEIMNEVERGFKKPKPVAQPQPSPKSDKIFSPLNNITDSTMYRSIGDFKKVLSPLRACNRIIERNSTLKKRRKTPADAVSPKAHIPLFLHEDLMDTSAKLNENITDLTDQRVPASDDNIIGPVIVREVQLPSRNIIKRQQTKYLDRMLDGDDGNVDKNDSITSNKSNGRNNPMVVAVTPKRQKIAADSNADEASTEIIGSSSMGIALKNQIRRNAWLSRDAPLEPPPPIPAPPTRPYSSSDGSSSNTIETAEIRATDHKASSSSNESTVSSDATAPANRKLNVSIKIVHKNVTPERMDISHKSLSNGINGNEVDTEESPSVLARIKFWNSLKAPIITPRPKAKPHQKRVEHSTTQNRMEAEIIEIIPSSPTDKDIEFNDISHKINQAHQWFESFNDGHKSLHTRSQSKSIENSPMNKIQSPNDLNNSLQISKFSDNFLDNSRYEAEIRRNEKELSMQKHNVSLITAQWLSKVNDHSILEDMIVSPKQKSVSETVKRLERANNPNTSLSAVKIIGNKLFNEKINNTDLMITQSELIANDSDEFGELMEIEGKVVGEVDNENEANALVGVEPPKMEIVPFEEPPKEDTPSPVDDDHINKGKFQNKRLS